ncbi:uncharacterized protein LOC115881092 [Sitophilus oryzae]|uniref:Uncharacterized protein LOC115881092 n=1 Tax=Sitophilus oryzae TaxID=7048 RepID=A0A6J2XUS1_SITOR|nr:uncharacterized protein LOC115881092 [Sitophilus oryzae]XP_030754322.1 uncharacterized protein LOC115881092 [Sitophilus oryzae]XP_030754324.1 uncharacterized protein LOC115881092 [Sitophilus oryzae]
MDFRNAPKKRTTNFREDETKLLIQLWGSPSVQNKLYLTHRKAPVMRLIAANMQKHGFYRTPDEIKTRIRNLKCLYHRIKKSMTTGAGIGTVDPDWPHYKSMDEILSRKNALRQSLVYNPNLLSEVNSETTVKQEVEDIDFDDDIGSYTSNSNGSDDEFEENPAFPATITPTIIEGEIDEKHIIPIKIAPKPSSPIKSPPPPPTPFHRIQISPNLLAKTPKMPQTTVSSTSTIVPTTNSKVQNAPPSAIPAGSTVNKSNNQPIPFPLLILNGVPNGVQASQNGGSGGTLGQKNCAVGPPVNLNGLNSDISKILKDMLEVQKENLEVEKERLQLEKQKLAYERTVGSQFLTMAPVFNEIFKKFKHLNKSDENAHPSEQEDVKTFKHHPKFDKDSDICRVSKRRRVDSSVEGGVVADSTRKSTQETESSHSDTDADSGIVVNENAEAI